MRTIILNGTLLDTETMTLVGERHLVLEGDRIVDVLDSVPTVDADHRIDADQVHATLYSIGDVDVATVATRFGGGGHRNAAGFTLPLARWLEELVLPARGA